MTLSTEQINELEALAKAATPGPWEHDLTYSWPSKVRSMHPDHSSRWVVDVPALPSREFTIQDAAFIAAANPETVKALIALIREQQATIREMNAAIHPFTSMIEGMGDDWSDNDELSLFFDDFKITDLKFGEIRRAAAVHIKELE